MRLWVGSNVFPLRTWGLLLSITIGLFAKVFRSASGGQEKTAEQIISIVEKMVDMEHPIIATRVDKSKAQAVLNAFPHDGIPFGCLAC